MKSSVRERRPPMLLLSLGLGVVIFGSIGAASYLRHKPIEEAKAEAWTIAGEPCPQTMPDQLPANLKIKRVITFGPMTIGRAYGHAECDEIAYGRWPAQSRYAVCQLSGPGLLQVRVRGADTWFKTGASRATLTYKDRRLTCVQEAARFRPR